MRYLIEDVKNGVSKGGFACGPVPGSVICEVRLLDESGKVCFVSLAEDEGFPNIYCMDHSTFRQQMDEIDDDDFWKNLNEHALFTGEYCEMFDETDSEWYPVFRYLTWMVRTSFEENQRFAEATIGKWMDEIEIPVTDVEEDYMEENQDEEEDSKIEAHIHELLIGDPENFDEIEDYISEVEEYYGDDLNEFTFREAIRSGARNYVESYADDFDLNDGDGFSSYLYETEDADMQEILTDHGAYRSWEDYGDCRFAFETVNGEILNFDSDFQQEVFEKYLQVTGLTREKVKEMMTKDYDMSEDDMLPDEFDRDWDEDRFALGICLKDGEISFKNMDGESGYCTQELLEELGWDCDFEGDSWKLETAGVYFVK